MTDGRISCGPHATTTPRAVKSSKSSQVKAFQINQTIRNTFISMNTNTGGICSYLKTIIIFFQSLLLLFETSSCYLKALTPLTSRRNNDCTLREESQRRRG